jgi:hypothetical protein
MVNALLSGISMKRIFLLILAIFLVTGIQTESFSQLNRRQIKKNRRQISTYRGKKKFGQRRYNAVGIQMNAMNYFGDIAPGASAFSTDYGRTKPGFGIFWNHRFGPRYTLRTSFNYGGIRGDDYKAADPADGDAIYRYARNLSFRNRIKELSVIAMIDLIKNESSYISRVQFTPYAFGGIGVIHHNPQAYVGEDSGLPEAGEWVNLQEIGTEGQNATLLSTDANFGIDPYSRVQIVIPLGIGIRYRLNQVMDISLETGMRITFTDYLDDVSANYVDPGVFDSDLARYLHDRSLEPNAAISGESRSTPEFDEFVASQIQTIVGRDGETYTVLAGYGQEFPSNVRGNDNDNDYYFVTSLKLSFIIGGKFLRAKFR